MKIFLDTADVAEIREYAASGLVDGVTTNPSLAAKTGKDYVESLKEICSIVPGAVSGEVLATDYEGMMKEAAVLAKIAKNIAVKVPRFEVNVIEPVMGSQTGPQSPDVNWAPPSSVPS